MISVMTELPGDEEGHLGGRQPRSGLLRGGWEAVGSAVWSLYGVLTVCKRLIFKINKSMFLRGVIAYLRVTYFDLVAEGAVVVPKMNRQVHKVGRIFPGKFERNFDLVRTIRRSFVA